MHAVRGNRSILIMAVASQAAFSLITFGLPAIGPEIRHRFDVGPAGFGAIFAAVGLGSAVALIPAGALVDRLGARRVVVAGGLVNGAGLVLAAFAGSAYAYSAALVLAGIGGAAVPVAGMTSLLRAFAPEKRGMAMGWRQLAVPLGGTLGAAFLPALDAAGGIRLAMLGAAVAATTTALGFAAVADGAPAHGGSGRRGGVGEVLRTPGFRPLLCVGLLYVLALGAVLAHFVGALRAGGMTGTEATAAFAVLNVVAAASRVVWGRVADRDGGTRRTRTLRDTGLLTVAAAVMMPAAVALGAPAAFPAGAVLAFGTFGFNGVVYLLAGELAGAERAGRAVGIASTVVFGAGALAAPIAGYAIERAGYEALWIITAVTAAAGVLATRSLAEPDARPTLAAAPATGR